MASELRTGWIRTGGSPDLSSICRSTPSQVGANNSSRPKYTWTHVAFKTFRSLFLERKLQAPGAKPVLVPVSPTQGLCCSAGDAAEIFLPAIFCFFTGLRLHRGWGRPHGKLAKASSSSLGMCAALARHGGTSPPSPSLLFRWRLSVTRRGRSCTAPPPSRWEAGSRSRVRQAASWESCHVMCGCRPRAPARSCAALSPSPPCALLRSGCSAWAKRAQGVPNVPRRAFRATSASRATHTDTVVKRG
jgi:hypothetical protein